MACEVGEYAGAAGLFGAAPIADYSNKYPERTAFDRSAALARRRLGDDAYDRWWKIGRTMNVADAVSEIDRLLDGRGELLDVGPTRMEDVAYAIRNGLA